MPRVLQLTWLVVAAIGLSVAGPGSASAAWPPSWGKATVQRVDGPGQLTLNRQGRAFKVRLGFVDLPQLGECGAVEATAALKGFVRRAPKRLRYTIYRTSQGQWRDADGRYVVSVTYPIRYRERSLAADLVRADWGRPGERAALDGPSPEQRYEEGGSALGATLEAEGTRPRRGVWARCGGRTHLPLGAAVPASSPATWSVDANGVTSSVGSIDLSPVLAPGSMLTVRQLAALADADVTRMGLGCRIWLPALQVRFFANADERASCGDAAVFSLRTTGPEPTPLARGGATGRPLADLAPLFPLLPSDQTVGEVPLSGEDRHPWAWTTKALVLPNEPVRALVTYASPELAR